MRHTISTTKQYDSTIIKEKHSQIEGGCLRCGGMLVDDQFYDLWSSGVLKLAIKRCIQCGDVLGLGHSSTSISSNVELTLD